MKHFCTVSDIGYINQGLALYQSLMDNMTEEFTLNYCCIGRDIFDKIGLLRLPNMNVWCTDDYEELQNVSDTSRQGYAWELGARFTKFVLDQIGVRDSIDEIMYIDSDIIIYPGFEKVYDEIGEKSIGIVPHLHIRPAPCQVAPGYPGGYNVGITYFKNGKNGKRCLDLWAYSVLNPYDAEVRTGTTGERYTIKLHNTCGDQRFLEMFPIAYPDDTHVIGQNVLHGAPWNMHVLNLDGFNMDTRLCKIDMNPGRDWMKKILPTLEQSKPMVYYHFAGFKPDYENDTYKPTRDGFDQGFMSKPAAQLLHDEYYQKMKYVKELYDL